MADGSSGGVGVRLFVQGGEIVKRTFNEVGDSGKRMWAGIASGEKAANPALRLISRGAGEVKGAISGLAAETGAFGRVLGGLGPWGVAAAAAMGGFAIALHQARAAMDFADELSDSAAQAQVSVKALQEYRYAALAAGGATEDADTALKGLATALGLAQAGSEKSLRWFKAIGLDREQLMSFNSAADILPVLADKIAHLGTEAEKAALADKFGIRPLLPLLEQGSEAIADLRQKAHDLGIVMSDDLVARAGEAHDQLETLNKVIDLQLKVAFADLAPVIVASVTVLADLAKQLREGTQKAGDAYKGVMDFADSILRLSDVLLGAQAPLGEVWRLVQLLTGVHVVQMQLKVDGLDDPKVQAVLRAFNPAGVIAGAAFDYFADRGRQGGHLDGGHTHRRDHKQTVDVITPDVSPPPPGHKGAGHAASAYHGVPKAYGPKIDYTPQEELDAKRQALDLELQLQEAEAAGDAARVEALRLQEDLLKRIADYRAAGLSPADATLSAQIAQSRIAVAAGVNMDGFTKIESPVLSTADRDAFYAQMRETFGEAFADGVMDGLESGDWQKVLEGLLKQSMAKGLESLGGSLFDAVSGGPGGGGFNLFSTAASFLGFGPKDSGQGNDAGGGLRDGWYFRAAETNTELAVVGKNGQINNHGDTVRLLREAMGSAGGGGGVTHVYDMRGAYLVPDMLKEVDRRVAAGEARAIGAAHQAVGAAVATAQKSQSAWARQDLDYKS